MVAGGEASLATSALLDSKSTRSTGGFGWKPGPLEDDELEAVGERAAARSRSADRP